MPSKKHISKKPLKSTSTSTKAQKATGRKRFGLRTVAGWFASRWNSVTARRRNFLARRPHRSFQLTRRRDYARSMKLPGYFSFTFEVAGLLWRRKVTFGLLGLVFMLLTTAFGLLGSEAVYTQFIDSMDVSAPDGLFEGLAGEAGRAGLLLLTSVTTGLTGELSEGQQIAAGFFSLYIWLTVVWLLRNIVSGKKVKLRDGLYSAGSPILSTFLLFMVLIIQLVPMAIVIIIAQAGWQSGFIQEGVVSMAAGLGLALVVVASLYWVVSTFFALVIVTLPGMYPFRALAIAGDLVIGRRLRLLYRVIWLLLTVVSTWVVVMIPTIVLDGLLKSRFDQIAWVPIVPAMLLLMTTITVIWCASYIYMLYRKVVDDDASPA
ncbi:MAG: hypothetical protein UY35_C0005G0048 [Candidatus Saccharibacteria bacterium GW2011_GWC2_48_9]|nr:MAG: hypothetical protein UY35_C0005G0048 [Candidatus Saccharibacteria bacterium GW2011_GWC2_48_9]HCH34212.1 hypothetical protein [Candidatus Saccharibacteria bacterium]